MDLLLKEFLVLFVILALIPLGIITAAGLALSVLQAATQIQEQSIAFALKIVILLLLISLAAPLSLRLLIQFLERMYLIAAGAGT